MLILEDLKKVARLQRSYGENRPGYITHDDKDLKGPSSQGIKHTAKVAANPSTEEIPKEELARPQSVRISVYIDKDPETGEFRMMRK